MKTKLLMVLSGCMLLSCSSTEQQQKQVVIANTPLTQPQVSEKPIRIDSNQPADIVNLVTITTKVQISMAYAASANFTGTVVPGYQANSCYLQKKAAQALTEVAAQAERLGYKLHLMDCYRPQRASAYFMSWVTDPRSQSTKAEYYPNVDKSTLNQGYIAAHSGHSRASTVDLTLLQKNKAGQWQPVDMGGTYDLFDPVSHLNSSAIHRQQKANRLLLKDLMQQQNFVPYSMEWWHFTLQNEQYPDTYFDFMVN